MNVSYQKTRKLSVSSEWLDMVRTVIKAEANNLERGVARLGSTTDAQGQQAQRDMVNTRARLNELAEKIAAVLESQ